jgi:hypothetical protein
MPTADDPIGLLPARLIIGINKRGVHFFRCVRARVSACACVSL